MIPKPIIDAFRNNTHDDIRRYLKKLEGDLATKGICGGKIADMDSRRLLQNICIITILLERVEELEKNIQRCS